MSALTDVELAGMAMAISASASLNTLVIAMADRETHSHYSTVPEVRAVRGPELRGKTVDATTHTSGGWGMSSAALREGGRLEFEVIYRRASLHSELLAAALAQSQEQFSLAFTDGTLLGFSALVSMAFRAPLTVSGRTRATVTLVISGAVTLLD